MSDALAEGDLTRAGEVMGESHASLRDLYEVSTPELDAVRPLVLREWSSARRQEASKAFYEKLRARYAITVQMPRAVKP